MIPTMILDVLKHRPLGLLFDIDGTLSPIAPTPDEARLYPGAAELLERASQHTHVGIITGRAITSGAGMVNVEGLTYIGTHGLEWSDGLPSSHAVQLVPEALDYVEAGRYLLDLTERELASRIPGLLVERKSVGGAIHYRLAPDAEQARQNILELLEEPAHQVDMRLAEGKRMVEVLAPINVNKGHASRRFVEHFGLHGVIFAGDDRTDLNAILEMSRLRQEGIASCSIAVQHADTLPALLEQADVVVQEVEGMIQLLGEIVQLLEVER
ncbi:MAG TPA: trehalose-phosphatase [Ktedonobacteraceae bacterium]|nr:trehalose-phosphatase [Ktedonobacteraceae bacterium]